METKLYINNDLDLVTARMQARQMAKKMGFATADQARISLAASELARLLSWGNGDNLPEILLTTATKDGNTGIKIVCLLHLDQANEEHPDENHKLTGIQQLMDEGIIEKDDNQYTRVTLIKWLK